MKLRTLLILVLTPPTAFVVYASACILHATWTDYQPPQIRELANEGKEHTDVPADSLLTCLIWNVGYGGMGEETAFFWDQGKQLHSGDTPVIMDEDVVLKNELGILSLLEQNEVDFCLLQEVDRKSKRSHFHSQFERISEALGSVQSFFGLNYHVRRIPVPNLEPFNVYGKVFSGLATHARPAVSRALRITLPGEFSWPDKVFQLDRCMLVTRTPHPLGEVVVVNLHLSAYDETGVIKAQQMAFLRDFVLEEFGQGHHVIVGGDWNQCPPSFDGGGWGGRGDEPRFTPTQISPDFLPEGWSWSWDNLTATHREGATEYVKDLSFVTTLDFFLCSPNVDVLNVRCLDDGFRHSDHQPVWAEFRLR